jgi:hypothetical protein
MNRMITYLAIHKAGITGKKKRTKSKGTRVLAKCVRINELHQMFEKSEQSFTPSKHLIISSIPNRCASLLRLGDNWDQRFIDGIA